METILLIIVLLLIFGGSGFYWSRRRRYAPIKTGDENTTEEAMTIIVKAMTNRDPMSGSY